MGTALRSALLLSLLLPAGAAAVAPQPPPLHGAWQQTDLRSIESGRPAAGYGSCLRLWLERRSYSFSGALTEGVYGHLLVSVPVVDVPGCAFAPPAREPLAYHSRLWTLSLRRDGDGWSVTAGNPVSVGPLDLETAAFTSTLRLEDGRLVERRDGSSLVFTRPGDPPPAAREALERGIEGLHSGRCVAVHRGLAYGAVASAAKVDQLCDLTRRARRFTGRYLALEVTRSEPFDRVPWGFLAPVSGAGVSAVGQAAAWVDRPGYVFAYTLVFEHQKLFGNAVVWHEEGQWRLAAFW